MVSLVRVSDHPRIYIQNNFLTEKEIKQILNSTSDTKQLYRTNISTRHDLTGLSFEMPISENPLLCAIRDRLENLVGFKNIVNKTMRFRCYDVAEGHPPHLDTYKINNHTLILTALMTLTDVTSGGETFFPDARPKALSFPPEAGRLILWFGHNCDGQVDPLSLHESKPIIKGKKCTLTYFFYQSLDYASVSPTTYLFNK